MVSISIIKKILTQLLNYHDELYFELNISLKIPSIAHYLCQIQ